MLRIGLTGGIGAGKSTVSATFAECGGIVVDGDVIAREVVEPGTEGLAKLVDAFGDDILLPDGALNRPALAAKAFGDEDKRATLNGIVHPLVAQRRAEIIAAVSEDEVVVEDIPLLVESGMAPMFPLVVIVHADPEVRVERLIKRGDGRSRRPGPYRRAGQRRAAARGRRRLAGQLRVSRANWWNAPGSCGTSASCRSPTTSARAKQSAQHSNWCRTTRRGLRRPTASSSD